MKIHAGRLLTPGGWRDDQVVEIRDGRIARIDPGTDGDMHCDRLTPGLFDVHAHGGEGFYYYQPDRAAYEKYLTKAAVLGVTDVLFTTGTQEAYEESLRMARSAMDEQAAGTLGGAKIRGIHLEGPFLSPKRPGAMKGGLMPVPSPEAFDERFAAYEDIIRMVTVATEREGARELVMHLLGKGIKVQSGHTDATYEEAERAFGWGVDSQCHTFNAARGIHHREPGVVAAALLNENVYCETICDFKHLHPATVRLIYRMKGPERMEIISDSVAVTGLPDGEHVINGHKYLIVDGTQRVNGGETLSGGACYLDGAVRNLISIGIPTEDAFRMASRTPAERIGIGSIGRIQAGFEAHLAAWDAEWKNQFTVIDDRVYQ